MGSGASASDIKRARATLVRFRQRIDDILMSLEHGPQNEVSLLELSRSAFSGPGTFAEADGLHQQFTKVHTHLTTLSRTLNEQIEAMGIAVIGANVGFDNLEDDLKARFWEIQNRAEARYEEQDEARTEHKQGKSKQATGDDKQATL
ncbi:hypothetical protein AB0I82_15440 [Streptomyces sp. NPDC050315]|uniref:hypothetical protein n=1 Tax=Streptomyces sp. NPDC050315 TaxID=3155039 RepID=UPI0034448478